MTAATVDAWRVLLEPDKFEQYSSSAPKKCGSTLYVSTPDVHRVRNHNAVDLDIDAVAAIQHVLSPSNFQLELAPTHPPRKVFKAARDPAA